MNIAKFSRKAFCIEHLWWVLLLFIPIPFIPPHLPDIIFTALGSSWRSPLKLLFMLRLHGQLNIGNKVFFEFFENKQWDNTA